MEHIIIPTDSHFSLKLEGKDLAKKTISCCFKDEILFKFPFPIRRLDNYALKYLIAGCKLMGEDFRLREKMLQVCHLDEPFIHSILAHVVLEKKAVDLVNTKVLSLNKPTEYPLQKFVKSPLYENIFFVIDCDVETQELLCVEVDPFKEITYRLVRINLRQVSVTQWKGPKLALADMEGCLSLTEADFYAAIENIKVKKGDMSLKDNEEY
jgi:hypothetical protein